MMVTDFIYVCLHIFFVFVFFADVAGEGFEDTTKASVDDIWSEADGCQCSHLFSTQGVALLNANSAIHLFSVGWQMGTFQMSPRLF